MEIERLRLSMALTICHTGDWHLGHTLYRRSREPEHAQFVAWLLDTLVERAPDALVIAGDVFDAGNPPGSAMALFYGFLAEARRRLPALTVVVVAGNHDSPARLAAPDPVLRQLGVWVVGSVPYDGGRIAAERMVVPVMRDGACIGRIAAVPYLRGLDLPAFVPMGGEGGHALGARRVYDAVVEAARVDALPLVITGHFAAAGARMSRESERLLVGGLDGTLPLDVIAPRGPAYVALGHLHLAQRIDDARVPGLEARYAGSPLPLSFGERNLEHEVRFVTLDEGGVRVSEGVRVPTTVALRRVPEGAPGDRAAVLAALASYPTRAEGGPSEAWPWIEVRARADEGERDLLQALERAAEERALVLAHVSIERPESEADRIAIEARTTSSLDVRDVLVARWWAEHGAPPPDDVLAALAEATSEARARLEQRGRRDVEREADRSIVRTLAAAARRSTRAEADREGEH